VALHREVLDRAGLAKAAQDKVVARVAQAVLDSSSECHAVLSFFGTRTFRKN
jgi:hypothetical protein